MDLNLTQIAVSVLLSSGFIGGVFALITKAAWSPEAKNDLARLGNEFAQQLLEDAKSERAELRLTIRELEHLITEKHDTIARLKQLADEKDRVIFELEYRMTRLAEKINAGEPINLQDIFGKKAPKDFLITKPDAI